MKGRNEVNRNFAANYNIKIRGLPLKVQMCAFRKKSEDCCTWVRTGGRLQDVGEGKPVTGSDRLVVVNSLVGTHFPLPHPTILCRPPLLPWLRGRWGVVVARKPHYQWSAHCQGWWIMSRQPWSPEGECEDGTNTCKWIVQAQKFPSPLSHLPCLWGLNSYIMERRGYLEVIWKDGASWLRLGVGNTQVAISEVPPAWCISTCLLPDSPGVTPVLNPCPRSSVQTQHDKSPKDICMSP